MLAELLTIEDCALWTASLEEPFIQPSLPENSVHLDSAAGLGIMAAALIAELGNVLAKELTFVARAVATGLRPGAKALGLPTSRADGDRARLACSGQAAEA
jgi:hypothetical protein